MMETAQLNGVQLAYEMKGSGEPLLLISPMIADGFLPFFAAPPLVDRYCLIRYHRRGWSSSTHTTVPVSITDHAADAAGLLDALGVSRAHVAGHSSGGVIGLQLAVDRPDLLHSLTLLEPSLLAVPSAQSFFQSAASALEAYRTGDHERAVAGFLTVVSGFDWDTCRAVIDDHVPGAVAQAIRDADTMFGMELPALGAWEFGPEEAAAISGPVLSVLGTETDRLWVEVATLLRSWLPHIEELAVGGAGHLLHIERPEPVARGVAAFLGRHPMLAAERAAPHAEARPAATAR